MASLLLLTVALCSNDAYAEAYSASIKDHRELWVYVGAEWCKFCPRTERMVQRNICGKRLVFLDFDRDRRLALGVLGKDLRVPQIVRYRYNAGKWYRSNWLGYVQINYALRNY